MNLTQISGACSLVGQKWPEVDSASENPFGWQTTTLVVPKFEKIRGLNLPGTPRATSACRGIPLFYLCIYVGDTIKFS